MMLSGTHFDEMGAMPLGPILKRRLIPIVSHAVVSRQVLRRRSCCVVPDEQRLPQRGLAPLLPLVTGQEPSNGLFGNRSYESHRTVDVVATVP